MKVSLQQTKQKYHGRHPSPWFIMGVLLVTSACGWNQALPSAMGTLPAKATPYAESPAAGICGESEGPVVTVTIQPDIPDPRCLVIRPDQRLKVVNRTSGSLQVALGPFLAEIDPGGEYLFDRAFGEYLASGVHQVLVSPCCSPELWLKDAGG